MHTCFKCLALCYWLFAGGPILYAQDVHFSQFYEHTVLRNPALMGLNSGDYRAGVDYRRQWGSITVPFQTVYGAAERRVRVNDLGDYLSFGAAILYDHAGSAGFNSFHIYPAFNYSKAFGGHHKLYLTTGVTAGYVQRSVNSVRMTFGDQFSNGYYSPDHPSAEKLSGMKAQYYDLGLGVSLNSSMTYNNHINYFLGAVAYHLNRPKVAFVSDEVRLKLPVKWGGQLGVHWLVEEHAVLTVHGNYIRQGKNQESSAGFLASWRSLDAATHSKIFAIYGGCFYRWNDAWIPTVKIDYKTWSITVSYDVTVSGLRQANNGIGGFELSLYTKGPFRIDGNTPSTACPRFDELLSPEDF